MKSQGGKVSKRVTEIVVGRYRGLEKTEEGVLIIEKGGGTRLLEGKEDPQQFLILGGETKKAGEKGNHSII